MKCFVMSVVVVWMVGCLSGLSQAKRGSKDRLITIKRKNPASVEESQEQNAANATLASPVQLNVTSTVQPSTRVPVKIDTSSRRHKEKRCCRIGYRAAKRRLFCLADRYYSAKYTNMEHLAVQKFQTRPPSKRTRRLMYNLERYCIKTQMKNVFLKCCLDGTFSFRHQRDGQ